MMTATLVRTALDSPDDVRLVGCICHDDPEAREASLWRNADDSLTLFLRAQPDQPMAKIPFRDADELRATLFHLLGASY